MDEQAGQRHPRRALTLKEAEALFQHAGSRRTLYLTALLTGLRRGELSEITWGDVDLNRHVVRVRPEVSKAK